MAQEPLAPGEFKPYVPDSFVIPEFTPRAVILGMLFGVVFGAVTVYVGLRAGLTVAASIPIAVLSISLLRALGKATDEISELNVAAQKAPPAVDVVADFLESIDDPSNADPSNTATGDLT